MGTDLKSVSRRLQAPERASGSSASRSGACLDKSLRDGVVIETHELGGNMLHHLLHRIVRDNLHEEVVTGVNLGREWT